MSAHVVVVGNEKGGSGKSTVAMHLIVGFLKTGQSVASIDLDLRQATLSRCMGNRRVHELAQGLDLPMPEYVGFDTVEGDEEGWLKELVPRLAADFDVLVIDTPGSDNSLNRLGHSFADTLITPLNDNLIDLDVLARVENESVKIISPSHYAEMVWEQKKAKAIRDGGSIDWIVVRNRLNSLDARNKCRMERLLRDLSSRIGFRIVSGLGERVVDRELFLSGLTLMDSQAIAGDEGLTLSQVKARQEVRNLVEAVRWR
jgi:chromosome partitioning protein